MGKCAASLGINLCSRRTYIHTYIIMEYSLSKRFSEIDHEGQQQLFFCSVARLAHYCRNRAQCAASHH